MSWIREDKKSIVHDMCTKILSTGHIPKHVAIIMDGNRRYAEKNNYERQEGHLHGFDKLSEVLNCSILIVCNPYFAVCFNYLLVR